MGLLEKIIQVPCDQCDGSGREEVFGNCKDQSNECCGGCTKTVDCDICDGRGSFDMTVNEAIEFEGIDVSNLYEVVYDLKEEIKNTSLKDMSSDIIAALVKDFT
jgi:hypothetical protein